MLYRFQKYESFPVSNRLASVKTWSLPRWCFSTNSFWNFKNIRQKYWSRNNIRYVHSASVLVHLQQRNYAAAMQAIAGHGQLPFTNKWIRLVHAVVPMLIWTCFKQKWPKTWRAENHQRKAYIVPGKGPMSPYLERFIGWGEKFSERSAVPKFIRRNFTRTVSKNFQKRTTEKL